MMNFGSLDEWAKEVPLHPDLEPFVRKGTVMGEMVHSPLVIQPFSMGRTRCTQINALYEQKLAQAEAAIAERNFERFIMLHERPYRFDALNIALDRGLPAGSPEYWEAVSRVWIDSENIHENLAAWKALWGGDATNRFHAMSEDDRDAFSKMRPRFRVYRGFGLYGTQKGLSWTTSRKRAIWFANRFEIQRPYGGSYPGSVGSGYVAKEAVYAYLNGRGEEEIVVDPDAIEKWEYCDL